MRASLQILLRLRRRLGERDTAGGELVMKIRIKMSAKNGQFEERKSKESTVQPVSLSLSPEDEEKPELFFFSLPSSFLLLQPPSCPCV